MAVETMIGRQAACVGHRAGDACTFATLGGTCTRGECCKLDYAHRAPDQPPPQVCSPCLTCQTAPLPLESLTLPDETSAAATPTSTLPAAVTAAETVSPSAPLTGTVAPADAVTATAGASASPHSSPDTALWFGLAVGAALLAWLFLRRRSS